MKGKVLVIVGPTGSGKTALSLELASLYNGEIINADSRQVYKGLDIGTEKITTEEMEDTPHHLLSIVDPKEAYTAQRFVADATAAIKDMQSRNKLPIIVGGTFFYIDMLLEKVGSAPVAPNPSLRAELDAYDEEELYAMVQSKDPAFAQRVDKNNKRRLLRALEILHVLPSVPSFEKQESSYDALIIGLHLERDVLKERLMKRAEAALARGLVEETESLLKNGVSEERLREIGLEYRLVLDFKEGKLSHEALLKSMGEKNWQYAKRQLVWLKRDDSIQWFKPEEREAIFTTTNNFLGLT